MTIKNKKMTSIPYKISMILAITFTSIIVIGTPENVFGANCPAAGVGGALRCYAVDTYSVFPAQPTIQGLSGYNTVYNNAVVTGFVANSNWVIFSDNSFVEVLWIDSKDGLSGPVAPTYACGSGGSITSSFGSPASGSLHKFEMQDTDNNNSWIAKIDSTTYSACTFTKIPDSRTVRTGYEIALVDTTPVTTDDHNLYQVHSGTWKYWQGTPVGGHSSSSTTSGFFVKYCGTGAEQFYHHKHGKGTAPASC